MSISENKLDNGLVYVWNDTYKTIQDMDFVLL